MTRILSLVVLFALLTLVGCELTPAPQSTPTTEILATETAIPPTKAPTPEPSSATPTVEPQVATEPPTITPLPTETFTASPTYNPYATYVIQPNDTLLFIIQQAPFFYRNAAIIDEIVRINDNILSPDQLPPPGSVILIPLPTRTPTPENFSLTEAAHPVNVPGFEAVTQVEVREGITILGIAGEYNTNLPVLATLNPQLFFIGCDFSNPSGGPDCNVALRVGDMVNVPAPTPTPTLSPTFSGLETATPTPTYAPPVAIFPPSDSTAQGRSFPLQWVSAGVLQADEVYLIEILDETAGTQHIDITRTTTYQLPDTLVPTDGQTHTIRWRVTVAEPNDQGAYRFISPQANFRTFYWQSR